MATDLPPTNAASGRSGGERAMPSRRLLDGIRHLNKQFYNRFTRTFAGKCRSPYALIVHTGRRSGRRYTTPVVADPMRDGFIIPLPYGAETDWCRNILAAGGGTLRHEGREYAVHMPAIIDAARGLPLMRPGMRCDAAPGGR